MSGAAIELVGFPMVEIVPQETNDVKSWFVGDVTAVVNSGGDWFMMIQLIFSSTKSRLDLLEKMRGRGRGSYLGWNRFTRRDLDRVSDPVDLLHNNPVLACCLYNKSYTSLVRAMPQKQRYEI